jgi:hypothetical protein
LGGRSGRDEGEFVVRYFVQSLEQVWTANEFWSWPGNIEFDGEQLFHDFDPYARDMMKEMDESCGENTNDEHIIPWASGERT